MRATLAAGSFLLALSAIVCGIWGAIASNPHLYLAAVILALAFFVCGVHAAEHDSKARKEHRK